MEDKARIIVIDDELGMREGSRRILIRDGHSVDIAECGEDGVELIKMNSYDLALVDYKMPGIDGFQVLQKVKEFSPETMVIIVTAYATIEAAVEATKKGAYDYISKPFTPDEFITAVNRALERRRLVIETRRLIEERQKNLLDLSIEKSRLKTIINSLNEGVIVTNIKPELVLFNPFAMKVFGIKNENIGKPAAECISDIEILEQIEKTLHPDTDKTLAFSKELKRDERVYKVDSNLVKDESGNPLGTATVIRDITEEKKLEAIKNQFVSMVSHELRAPVAAIKGYIDVILSGILETDPGKAKSILERSALRAETLLNLINDLLEISRMDRKTKERKIEELDLAEVVNGQLEFFGNEITRKGLSLNNNLPSSLPRICADKGEIDIVFTNLISNAIKYNRENGSITASSSIEGDYIKLTISDTGIGMTEEDTKRLFHDFFRAKNEHTKMITGTGLGLSIVKRIIESYHGAINVTSEYLKGTTFTVLFPIHK